MPKQNQTKQTNTRGQQTSLRFAIRTAHPVKKKNLTCIFQFLAQTTQAQLINVLTIGISVLCFKEITHNY